MGLGPLGEGRGIAGPERARIRPGEQPLVPLPGRTIIDSIDLLLIVSTFVPSLAAAGRGAGRTIHVHSPELFHPLNYSVPITTWLGLRTRGLKISVPTGYTRRAEVGSG